MGTLLKMLRRKQVEDITGFSRSTIYRRMREGTFPLPRDTGGAVRWMEDSLIEWQESLPDATGDSSNE